MDGETRFDDEEESAEEEVDGWALELSQRSFSSVVQLHRMESARSQMSEWVIAVNEWIGRQWWVLVRSLVISRD